MKDLKKEMYTIAIAGGMLALSMNSLVGCGSKSDDPLSKESKSSLIDMVNSANEEIVACYDKIAELEEKVGKIEDERGGTSSISEINDGTGRLGFNTVEGYFELPEEFNYPGSTQAPNTGALNINEAVKIYPTPNWTNKMSGTKLEMKHTSDIYGIISIGYLEKEYQTQPISSIKEYLEQYLEKLPIDTKKISAIYLDEYQRGVDNISHCFIDNEDAIMRCGLLGYGEYSIQYFFIYKGEQDVAKDDVILSLLKGMKIWNLELNIE